ncbi:histidine phosphotransferase family protein [Actibacterium sp. XHP0104]|uniref:histidine phosphotransferase family protein n=1 Tax=Actibacterium sp. XHP0104 TaxID=2984335 RepID=UPI0021E8F0AB|nr:histidine phosphotransferase family protein [Actibacterium sp. XHP0104]MCV2881155.1 histidine phosphotransferase family protein [Actibacterium sp. XHP0104]
MSAQPLPDLNALLGSRICHDLINPVGAISNGLELLGMTGVAGDSPEMQLLSDSVRAANARIRLFRIAFGQASAGQMVARGEIDSILADAYGAGRLSVQPALPDQISRAEAKLLLLLVLALEGAMPLGGVIDLRGDGGAWRLHASAKRLNCDPRLWGGLTGAEMPADLGPAEVQFALIPDAARQLARRLSVQMSDTEIKIGF